MLAPDYDTIWPVVPDEELVKVATEAQAAFWRVVAERFPDVETGDFPPDTTMQFDTDCKRAVAWWLSTNHPKIK